MQTQQENQSVETGVDKLINYLKGKGQVSIKELSKSLGISEDLTHNLVDFLVEEKILGMEYKLTNPFVYLLKKEEEFVTNKNISTYKRDFEEEAKNKNIPENKTEYLWKQHVLQQLDMLRQFFNDESKKRALKNPDALWKEYQDRIVGS